MKRFKRNRKPEFIETKEPSPEGEPLLEALVNTPSSRKHLLRRFEFDPSLRVHVLDSLVDHRSDVHTVVDMPDTECHDDAVYIKQLDQSLYRVFISTPRMSHSFIDANIAAEQFEASSLVLPDSPSTSDDHKKRPKRPCGLATGTRRAQTLQVLTDGKTIYELFAYSSLLRCRAYASSQFDPDDYPLEKRSKLLPPIPQALERALCAPFNASNAPDAIERLMFMQYQGLGAVTSAYGVPALFANIGYRFGQSHPYIALTTEPVAGGANVVKASSPLRLKTHFLNALQVQGITDRNTGILCASDLSRYAARASLINQRAA